MTIVPGKVVNGRIEVEDVQLTLACPCARGAWE
jgi:hypothetical protein